MIKEISEEEYDELFRRVGVAMQRFHNLRYGQAVFNEAHSMWPDFAMSYAALMMIVFTMMIK